MNIATEVGADLLVLTGRRGALLGAAGADEATHRRGGSTTRHRCDEISTFTPHARGVLQLVSVPILLEGEIPDILGRLTVGFFLDDRLASEFKALTGSEIAFGAQGRILASTLPPDARAVLAPAIRRRRRSAPITSSATKSSSRWHGRCVPGDDTTRRRRVSR